MMAGRTRRRTLLAITAAAALVTAADGRVGARAQDAPATAPAAQGAFDAALRSYERALQGLESDAEQGDVQAQRSEEHTSELQSLMRISYAVFCLKKKKNK